ncbi:uncharacterized protein LOC130591159 [Beta vulgaris subsp. vulgaris]|uniref:uncharacterized protein LOC130591159 n=1 Tax=Beta vulgaris subsp. vulgaris TaxID=3555 RepID=UPI002546AFB0|nr:uncharacterized protein LOC130591159 [Beta vulgaris subsp. vulgaris]
MCSIKRKSNVKGKQTVKVSEHVSAVFQKRMPKKCDDPGMFTIPITLGDTKIDRAMLDLGASINVLPYSLYESLTLGDLLPTNVVIQLADRSTSIPRGVVEDVLVVVDKLTFPADFYFDGQIIEFNMYDAMRYPNIEDHSLCAIDVFEPCVQGVFDVLRDDDLQSVLDFSLNADSLEFCLPDNVLKIVVELNELSKLPLNPSNYKPMPLTVPSTRPLPSVVQAPNVRKRPCQLSFPQVDLGTREQVGGGAQGAFDSDWWSIADIHGISPSTCMHRILLEDEAKPVRQPQRRLNPHDGGGKEGGRAFYCFLDGYSGYFQVPIAPEDQEKTTFTCPFGTFAYRRMPFGLCNAPATFQRCMVSIFSDFVGEFLEVFMDDFTVHGDSFDQCLYHLSLVLKRCIESHLVLNSEKCHFMVEQGIVLGHVVSSRGIELQKDVDFVFDDACKKAFDSLKEKLTSAPVIQAPIWSLPFEIMCDASAFAVGAVLGQKSG